MELILIIVAVVVVVIISNQYSGLKKMDKIQSSLDRLNQNLEIMISKDKNGLNESDK